MRTCFCVANGAIAPFYWLYRSTGIYVGGCCVLYSERCCIPCIKLAYCHPCGCGCYNFVDKSFKPDNSSIGNWSGGDPALIDWRRGSDLFPEPEPGKHDDDPDGCCKREPPAYLFSGKVEPSDVAQGQIGNCWMMTGLAAMAEHPGSIRNLFVTNEYNDRGKYTVRIFDGAEPGGGRWKKVTVDDYFPCQLRPGGSPFDAPLPLFAQPSMEKREIWPLVYEKALAKLWGGYDQLQGGNVVVALNAFTGDPVFHMSKEDSKFTVYTLSMGRDHETIDGLGRPKLNVGFARSDQGALSYDEMFKVLKKFVKRKAVIGAGTSGTDKGESNAERGLVRGHAYAVLDVQQHRDRALVGKSHRLIKLRNPWGRFEWDGKWADGSEEWATHKRLAWKLKRGYGDDGDDGEFWMSWEDFCKEFDQIDLCDRSTGFRDVSLEAHEAAGVLGPCRGCLGGCANFWLTCQGCRASGWGNRGAIDRLERDRSSSKHNRSNKVTPGPT